MERRNPEEIVAYRIGESLFCPNCHDESEKSLKAVQNPNEPQVTIPSKPIKAKDLTLFICKQCKSIIGDPEVSDEIKKEFEALREQMQQITSVIPYRFRESKNLMSFIDTINNCQNKISFVESFFSVQPPERQPEISEDDASGLCLILAEIEEDLGFISEKILEKLQKGLIIEKKAS